MNLSIKSYKPFTKEKFENLLAKISPSIEFFGDFYYVDWIFDHNEWKQVNIEIKECCYFLAWSNDYCIRIYSSVDRETGVSRNVGDDAIRVVAASTTDGKPVRRKFTRINRNGNWQINLRKRISKILESFDVDIKCTKCGNVLFLKRNSKDNSRFLGCSNFPNCPYVRNFNL